MSKKKRSNNRKKKSTAVKRPVQSRASGPVVRPWYAHVGLYTGWFVVMAVYMYVALLVASAYPDVILRQALLALPAVTSTVLRPVPMGPQFIRWLALWVGFWVAVPIASSAVFVVGGAWICKWAWNDARDRGADTPANTVVDACGGAWERVRGKLRGKPKPR